MVVTVCAASFSAAVLAENALPSKPIAEFNVEIRNGIPNAEVFVSGQSFKLFIDLGGFRAISLTTAELARANVKFVDKQDRYQNASGKAFEARQFIAPNVSVGGVSFGDLEGGEIVYAEGEGPPDRNGYIGMGLLGNYLVVFDYPAGRVRFYQSGDYGPLQRECGDNVFPIMMKNGVAASIGQTEYGDLLFEWDTGTTHNFLRPSALPTSVGAGAKLDDGPPVATLSRLSMGGKNYGPLEFRLVQFAMPAVDGVLGAGLLSSRKVCLDLPMQKGAIASAP